METMPVYTYVVFGFATLLSTWLFYKATGHSKKVLLVIAVWMVGQSVVAATGFYHFTQSMPPRFALLIMPPLLFIATLFMTRQGRGFIDALDIKWLTLLHTVRIPVEIGLLLLSIDKFIPRVLTFEGINFDILAGLTAPIIYYIVFLKKGNRKWLLAWNFIALGLLINIVTHAVLAVPTPIQQLAFDQPNVGVLYFPVTLLPAVIVPLVLVSLLASIRQLLKEPVPVYAIK